MRLFQPKKYSIAICRANVLGVITSNTMEEVIYPDGNKGIAWTGFAIENTEVKGLKSNSNKTFNIKVGDLWSSKYPQVLLQLDSIQCEVDGAFDINKTIDSILEGIPLPYIQHQVNVTKENHKELLYYQDSLNHITRDIINIRDMVNLHSLIHWSKKQGELKIIEENF